MASRFQRVAKRARIMMAWFPVHGGSGGGENLLHCLMEASAPHKTWRQVSNLPILPAAESIYRAEKNRQVGNLPPRWGLPVLFVYSIGTENLSARFEGGVMHETSDQTQPALGAIPGERCAMALVMRTGESLTGEGLGFL